MSMKLSALMDFPDDALHVYQESTMYKLMERLKQMGVSRVYMQCYGNRDYGHFWDHNAPWKREMIETANNIPEFNRVFVEAANKYGIEPVAVMRPQEQGIWITFSPFYKEARENPGIPYTGGDIMVASKFLLENPELRIKRRTWDIDPDALSKTICSIKLYKQNNKHSRIRKENIKIFVSQDNSNYIDYKDDFDISFSYEKAKKDVVLSSFNQNYPTETITNSGDKIEVITIGRLNINERYIAVEINCSGKASEEEQLFNTPCNTISIFDKNGDEICSSPGHASRFLPKEIPCLEGGFHFDDGFGESFAKIFDPDNEKGYIAISKGKDEFVHAALCVLEPKVQEYWFKWLDKAMDDGFVMIGNRIECHSIHVDEPYAYGYNDCIKQEYYKRFGQCSEKDMELSKIAEIRGDAYTALFIEGAKRVRARGKKVYLTLNVEMLYDPIPIARHMAYPMNVQWQWEKWLEEIKPDEINIRSYQTSPDFILNDPQCKKFIETPQPYQVPMTLERYGYWDFAAEYEMVRDTGIFSRMTYYEINDIIQSDGKGGLVEIKPELLKQLENLTKSEEERK